MLRRRWRRRGKVALWCCGSVGGVVLLALAAIALFVARLSQGPVPVDGLGQRIADALHERFGHGFEFRLGQTAIIGRGYGPTLDIAGLTVKLPGGDTILDAPRAEIAVDVLPLIVGQVTPKRLEIFDVELRLDLLPDGALAVSAGNDAKTSVTLVPGLGGGAAETAASPAASSLPASPSLPAATSATAESTVAFPPHRKPSLMIKQAGAALRVLFDVLTNPSSPIAAVDRVGISRGRLVINDRTTDSVTVFQGLELGFDKSSGITTFKFSADGQSAHWSIGATASGAPGMERRLDVQLDDFTADEIAMAAGVRNLGVDFDTPLSARFNFVLGADNALREATGHFRLGAGYLRLDDPDHEPMLIDELAGGFRWNPATRGIDLDETHLSAGKTAFFVAGHVTPPLESDAAWKLDISSTKPGTFGPERPGEEPLTIDNLDLALRVLPTERRFVIDRFAFRGPDSGFAMNGDFDWREGPHLRLAASIQPTPARTVLRLWPSFMVPRVRGWLLDHVQDGRIDGGSMKIDYDAAALAAIRSDRLPPDNSVSLDFAVSGGRLDFIKGVPSLRDMEGKGHVTGLTTAFNVSSGSFDAGNGRKLDVSDTVFTVPNAGVKPTPAQVTARLSGGLDAVNDMLARDGLKPYVAAGMPDPSAFKGQVDGRLGLDLKLGSQTNDTVVRVAATVANFSADKLMGKEKFDNGTMTVTVDSSGLRSSGQGRMFGAPATLDINKPTGRAGDATLNIVLDDAARARMGMGAGSGVTGTVAAHVTASLNTFPVQRAQVEIDLARAAVETPLPGFGKIAGRPGKVAFVYATGNDGTVLDQISAELGGAQVHGSIELGADQSFAAAKLTQVRLSPGDDMKIDVTRAGDVYKLAVRGSTIDARPFLKGLVFSPNEAPAGTAAAVKNSLPLKDFEVDLKAAILTGYNKQAMTNVDMRLAKHGEQLRQFALSGKFGRDSINGSLASQGGGQQVDIVTADAGSLLSFIDLYKHMEGGRLGVAMRVNEPTLAGVLEIRDFILRDEPALRRLVAEGLNAPAPTTNEAARVPAKINPGAVNFNRLKVNFLRSGSRVELKEGTMYGPEIGLTVEGWLDYSHDKVAMNGVFVPAFAVNNLFSKIPLFGLLLGGGNDEGLFAINYRISGLASTPTLSINPLTAIAPGFLRKIIGAADATNPGAFQPLAPGVPPPGGNAGGAASGAQPAGRQ